MKKGCTVLFLGLIAFLCVVLPTFKMVEEWLAIIIPLHHAKSVKLVHFAGHFAEGDQIVKDKVYDTKDLAPSEFSEVASAVLPLPDAGVWGLESACFFDPHHEIILTDDAGKETDILVCFDCDHIRVNRGETLETPLVWRNSLRALFARHGMTNDPERYRKDWMEIRSRQIEKPAPPPDASKAPAK